MSAKKISCSCSVIYKYDKCLISGLLVIISGFYLAIAHKLCIAVMQVLTMTCIICLLPQWRSEKETSYIGGRQWSAALKRLNCSLVLLTIRLEMRSRSLVDGHRQCRALSRPTASLSASSHSSWSDWLPTTRNLFITYYELFESTPFPCRPGLPIIYSWHVISRTQVRKCVIRPQNIFPLFHLRIRMRRFRRSDVCTRRGLPLSCCNIHTANFATRNWVGL